jgi:hypothetical protein
MLLSHYEFSCSLNELSQAVQCCSAGSQVTRFAAVSFLHWLHRRIYKLQPLPVHAYMNPTQPTNSRVPDWPFDRQPGHENTRSIKPYYAETERFNIRSTNHDYNVLMGSILHTPADAHCPCLTTFRVLAGMAVHRTNCSTLWVTG